MLNHVLVIDASVEFCRQVRKILIDQPKIKKVDTFTNIYDGMEAIFSMSPDIVLLDVNVIEYEEQNLFKKITERTSVPVIVTALDDVYQITKTTLAVTSGAIDYIKFTNKDSLEVEKKKEEIYKKLFHVSEAKRQQKRKNEKDKERKSNNENADRLKMGNKPDKESIVLIGASTGGPKALHKILHTIPENFPAPILIVQHMPEGFTKSLAERLNNLCRLEVKEAEHGEPLKKGTVYIAPGNNHMKVVDKEGIISIEINKDSERLGHRPSINNLFESAAKIEHTHKIAVILTGMGKDGAEGSKRIKEMEKEAVIIAESSKSAVIFGMPKAVIETGCVTEIFDLDDISQVLIDYLIETGGS